MQSFSYDALNRLTLASTNSVGEGQYSQTYTYDPATGNLSSKSDLGDYTYSPTQPHAVTQAGASSYAYDQNGNMISRTVGGVDWTYTYNAEGQLTAVRKNNQLMSEYGYDGDGKRVWAKDYEGYLATNPKVTRYIGNYYEVQVEGYKPDSGGAPSQPCSAPSFCTYFPFIARTLLENVSYFYADGQRIAMKNNEEVIYLYGDHLGSVSAVEDEFGNPVSQTLYQPWGTTRYTQGTSPTDYAYTGQRMEGDIYFYNARWYDPSLGRFMQADTLVPTAQGTQGFDRFAYVNNNPPRYTDPSGYMAWIGDGGGETYKSITEIILTPLQNYYGWTFTGEWNYHEAHEVSQAATAINRKINSLGSKGNEWINTYLSKVSFYKTPLHHSNSNLSFSDLFGAIGVTFPGSSITLSRNYSFDSSIIIHELGHVLDNYFGPTWQGGAAVFGGGMSDQFYRYAGGDPSGVRCIGNVYHILDKTFSFPSENYGWNSQADFFAQHFMYQMIGYPSGGEYSETKPAIWMKIFLSVTLGYLH